MQFSAHTRIGRNKYAVNRAIQQSFYLLNTCTICAIFLYIWTQCIDGFSLLSQRHIRKGNDAKISAISPLHNPVTWYKITHAGVQVAQQDFQNDATSTSPPGPAFVLEVPMCNSCTSMCDFVPCDWILQRAYSQLFLRYQKNPVKCSACAVAQKIETNCFCRNLPISNDPAVRISRNLAKNSSETTWMIYHKKSEFWHREFLIIQKMLGKRFTANYENRLCQNSIRTVLTEGI